MTVKRDDLDKCNGCQKCMKICPMDVFRFDSEKKKSVIAFPENCQSCGMCYLECKSHSLCMSDEMYAYSITSYR